MRYLSQGLEVKPATKENNMKEKKNETVVVKLLGLVNQYWGGVKFDVSDAAKAQPITTKEAKLLCKAFKPGEYEILPAPLKLSATAEHNALLDAKQASAALQTQQSVKLKELGRAVIDQVVATGRKTFDLCKYIRDNMVAPKLVSFELTELGLSKSFVSKINRVAHASDEHFNAFAAQTIGFKETLQLARGAVVESLAASSGDSVVDVKAMVQELEEEEESEGASLIAPTEKELKDKADKVCQRAAAVLGKQAEADKLQRQRSFTCGNGYKVVVMKDKSWKAPKPQNSVAEIHEGINK